ncbi:hypothetical protein CTAYLR_009353 [Chrysophaeum taylorii]|uniref:Uncharacterized protein n=1 Tax=Chrysophaeum taylorii TaxID=2483200 RepID=A0AAD7XPH6_9STRA|nr:hypothetical protein CTAYLR_009353 [Chrysophaeum taylorii]
MSFEEAKQFLRREDEDGSSLYEHLSRVLTKIIVEKPANANAMFEQISQEMRGTEFIKKTPPAEGDQEVVRPEKEAQLEWCGTISRLYEEMEEREGTFPDLMTEANLYEWAGISFGRAETYRLYLAIKAKALQEGLKLRFWGKILARSGDYYVAQAENSEPPSAEDVKTIEGAEGANKYAFWVCKYAGGDWTKLPNVSPEAIVVARQIKRYLTGDLDAKVPSYPPFPGGTEAHLVRAQIAQITAECCVSPAGFYQEDDEAEEGIKSIKKVDEMEDYKSMDDLKDGSNWKHHELPINVNGRCNQPPVDEEVDAESADLPDMPLLAPIADDDPAWRIEACPGGTGESPDSAVVAKSLKWPGAVAAAFGNKFVNVYCGFGYSSNRGTPYQPPPIAPIQKEWAPVEEETDLVEDEDKITAPVFETEGDEEEA